MQKHSAQDLEDHAKLSNSLERLVGALLRPDGDRYLVGDRQAIPFEGDDLPWVIGEHAQASQAEVDQDLCADATFVLQQPLPGGVPVELAARVIQNMRQRAGSGRGGIDPEAASRVVQIDEHSAIFGDDGFERVFDDVVAVAIGGPEYIAGEAVRMHAHERRRASKVSANQSDVLLAVHVGSESDHAELAIARRQSSLRDAPDVPLISHSVTYYFSYSQQLQAVRAAKLRELRHPGHRAVLVHDFADHARGRESRHTREVHGRFGLAGAHEHTTGPRAQREDMAGTRQG